MHSGRKPVSAVCAEAVLANERIPSAEDEAAQGQISLVEPRTCGYQGAWKPDWHDHRFEDLMFGCGQERSCLSAEDEAAQGQISLVEPRTCGYQGAWKPDWHDHRFEDLMFGCGQERSCLS